LSCAIITSMEIPDPIELGENRMERWANTHIFNGQFFCDGCKQWHAISNGYPSTADPYSIPICGNCSLGEKKT